jgi:hypothetical protein
MMSPGFAGRGCGEHAGGPVEVVLQRLKRAVPVAGQRGQELLRHPHRRGTQPVAHAVTGPSRPRPANVLFDPP